MSSEDYKKYAIIAGGVAAVAAAVYFMSGSCCKKDAAPAKKEDAAPTKKEEAAAPAAAKEPPFPRCHITWKLAMDMCKKEGKPFGEWFYDRKEDLFANPGVEETFFGATDKQSQKMALPSGVTAVLGLVEKGDLDAAFKALNELGLRHIDYCGPVDAGIEGAYDLVGANLVKTLTRMLGTEAMNAETVKQWSDLYAIIKEKCVTPCKDAAAAAPHLKKFYAARLGTVKKNKLVPDAQAVIKAASVSGADVVPAMESLFSEKTLDAAIAAQSIDPIADAAKAVSGAIDAKCEEDKAKALKAAIAAEIKSADVHGNWCLAGTYGAAVKTAFRL